MPVKLLGFLTSTLAAAALGVALCAGPARAQDKKPDARPAEAAKRPSDTPPPNCLDRSITDELGASLRPRGVQKKTFLKRFRAELIGHGGIYASDLMSSSYLYGGAVAWWLYEDLGFEVSFDLSPVALDIDGPVAGFFGDQRFQKKTGYLGLANVLWSPVHFKLRTEGGGISPVWMSSASRTVCSPGNTGPPVNSSYRITPSENTSERGSSSPPATCSGDM